MCDRVNVKHWHYSLRRLRKFETSRQHTTKIDGVVCPQNISETVAGRLMELAHPPRIASTMINFKTNFTAHFINHSKNNSANRR